jgi:fatty-acyl-CoA synthase
MRANPFSSAWASQGADARQRPPGQQSYVSGATDEPLRFMTVSALLDRAVLRHGGRPAAIFHAERRMLSWHDLQREADALATGLLALGLRRGNRVGIWSPNRSEWLLTQFATARIGVVLVNINPSYQAQELGYALEQSGCRALVLAPGHKGSDYLALLRRVAPEIDRSPTADGLLQSRRLPGLKHVVLLDAGLSAKTPLPPQVRRFSELMRLAGPAQLARLSSLSAALDPDDPINIQYTSGTTGSPKGATLTHFNIVNNARFVAQAMALTAEDRLCIPVPLYHCFGMVLGVLACVAHGATMVFPGEGFDAAGTLDAVERHRCTALHGVPTMFIAFLADPKLEDRDLTSLRTGIMAGAPCPIDVMRRVVTQLHLSQITIAYGMTETSPVSFQSSTHDALEQRVATVGRIQPHLEAKIIDANGAIVPLGQTGELCTRGYAVMRGYWRDTERTREAIDEAGWMHTGDLATIDADGCCRIVGRAKDLLIRGGENIDPREVEDVLRSHPAVQDAQVFGVPDARLGEEVAAWVVLAPGSAVTADELTQLCRGRLAHFKAPRHIRFVPGFPLTATGKPQKFVMREAMAQELAAA